MKGAATPQLTVSTKFHRPQRITRSYYFYHTEIFSFFLHLNLLKLAENMLLKLIEQDTSAGEHALQYPEYLLKVAEGRICENQESEIELASTVRFPPISTDLVGFVSPNLEKNYVDINRRFSRDICVTETADRLP